MNSIHVIDGRESRRKGDTVNPATESEEPVFTFFDTINIAQFARRRRTKEDTEANKRTKGDFLNLPQSDDVGQSNVTVSSA